MERIEPWFTETALKLLEYHLQEYNDLEIFEFGSGEGDEWLYNRCFNLTTVEHDRTYLKTEAKGKHIFHERPYNAAIAMFEDESLDIIIVDGRDRVKCIVSSIPKLKPGGWLILDNSEREYYQAGMDLMADWNRIDCRQMRPDKYNFTYPNWTTSIFIKP